MALTTQALGDAAVSLEGTIETLVVEGEPGSPRREFYLLSDGPPISGRVRLIHTSALERRPPRNSVRYRVTGTPEPVTPPTLSVSVLQELTTQALLQPPQPSRAVRVAAVQVHYTDDRNSCDLPAIRNNLLEHPTSVRALFSASSHGEFAFEGDVLGPVVVPRPASCDPWALGAAVDAVLISSGVQLQAYSHVLYSLPFQWPGCAWSGVAALPGSRSWVRGCLAGMMSHELGHNLGMNHASLTQPDGTHVEYGDLSDTMGAATPARTHNAPHKVQMGWIEPASVVDVDQSQMIRLAPTITPPREAAAFGRSLVARIALPGQPGMVDSYWLSYRAPEGFDVGLPAPHAHRLNIHLHPGPGPMQAQNTRFVAGLLPGESFSSADGALLISVVSAGPRELQAQVTLSCRPRIPALSLFPASGVAGPNSRFETSLVIANRDGLGCAPAQFSTRFEAPPGLAVSGLPASLTLSPEESKAIPIRIAPGAAAKTGRAGFALSMLRRSGGPPLAVKTQGQVLVDLVSPSVPDGLSARALPSGEVELSWRASSDAGSGVALYMVHDLGVPVTQTSLTKVVLTPTHTGPMVLSVMAIDRVANTSAQSATVVIQPVVPSLGSSGGP